MPNESESRPAVNLAANQPRGQWIQRVVAPSVVVGLLVTAVLESGGVLASLQPGQGIGTMPLFSALALVGGIAAGGMVWMNRDRSGLDDITTGFGMMGRQAAEMLGIDRRTYRSWRRHGIPADQAPRVDEIRQIAKIINATLPIAGRLHAVNRPVEAFGGQSIVEMIKNGQASDVLHRQRQAVAASRQSLQDAGLAA